MIPGTLLAWLALAAAAHPVGDRAAAQSTVLTVHRDRVDVDFYADVPDLLVRTARPGSADRDEVLAAMATELASGLLLRVDGQTVPLQVRTPSPPPRPSSEHTMGFTLHLVAALEPGPRALELVTANLVDTQSYFAGDVRVGPGLVVRDCSLLGMRDGRVVRDDTLRWTRGEDRRRLSVTLGPPRPRWWPVLAGEPDEPRRSAVALAPRPRDLLRAGVLTPGTLGLSAALAVALGVLGAADRPRTRLGEAAAAVGVGVLVAVLPRAGAVEGLSALAVVAALVASRRYPPALPPAAAAALAGATHAPLAAACVGAAFAAGASMPWRSSRRGAAVLGLLVTALLAVRALGAAW